MSDTHYFSLLKEPVHPLYPVSSYRAMPKTAIRPAAKMGMPKSRAALRAAAAGDELAGLEPPLLVASGEPEEVREGIEPPLELEDGDDEPSWVMVVLPH
jgi:hypothetical protein